MELLANALWLVGSLPLLGMLVFARPTRGENLTAAHLVTGPIALPPALAAAIFLGLGHEALGSAAWWGFALLPGYWVALLSLPLVATNRRGARLFKFVGLLGIATPGLLGNGALLAPWVPWLGYATLASLAGITYALVAPHLARLLPRAAHRFLTQSRRPSQPSSFELSQATWQRERWQHVPPSATVDELLPFVRAFAPEVKAASLERLAAHPDLATSLSKAIVSGDDSHSLHYVVHHYPHSRRELAPALTTRLEHVHTIWSTAFRQAAEPPHSPGSIVGLLDASVAVLRDGGELRPSLLRWQSLLAGQHSHRDTARQLARYLR